MSDSMNIAERLDQLTGKARQVWCAPNVDPRVEQLAECVWKLAGIIKDQQSQIDALSRGLTSAEAA